MSSNLPSDPSRRGALKCLAFGGVGTVFVLAGGILAPVDLALAATAKDSSVASGIPLFLQISDSHIGFNKEANPDVAGTLKQTIDYVNAMPIKPALTIHTGDITQLSTPDQFDTATQVLKSAKASQVYYIPGEHDVFSDDGKIYLERYGKGTQGQGWQSFDYQGVHFIGLINVLNLKQGTGTGLGGSGLGQLGNDQLQWLEKDVKGLSSSTPIVVFAHVPLWTIYPEWGWGTEDGAQALSYLKRFGSITVLNGHIHQILQKVEGNVTFHTARSTAFPQPAPGTAPAPGPMKDVPADKLRSLLGLREVTYVSNNSPLAIVDSALG